MPRWHLNELRNERSRSVEEPLAMETTSSRDEIVEMKEAGITNNAEIGRRLGISRERVRQIDKGKPRQKPQKPALDSRVMLGTGDVAQLLGIHVNTVRRWSRRGILKSYRIGSRGDRRFRREDIDSFLKEAESGVGGG